MCVHNYNVKCMHRDHWMLIVACLRLNAMYILDSQQSRSKKLDIKGRLNGAWLLHRVQGGKRNFGKPSKLDIKVIKVSKMYTCLKFEQCTLIYDHGLMYVVYFVLI